MHGSSNQLQKFRLLIRNSKRLYTNYRFSTEILTPPQPDANRLLEKATKDLAKTIEESGTSDIETILRLCCGRNYVDELKKDDPDRYAIIKRYCKPFRYKLLSRRGKKASIVAPKHDALPKDIVASANYRTLEAFDQANTSKNFCMQIHGASA